MLIIPIAKILLIADGKYGYFANAVDCSCGTISDRLVFDDFKLAPRAKAGLFPGESSIEP